MERLIRESHYVLVVCTEGYKHRFDKRAGGAVYEGTSSLRKSLMKWVVANSFHFCVPEIGRPLYQLRLEEYPESIYAKIQPRNTPDWFGIYMAFRPSRRWVRGRCGWPKGRFLRGNPSQSGPDAPVIAFLSTTVDIDAFVESLKQLGGRPEFSRKAHPVP
jgi:hypothetical protein